MERGKLKESFRRYLKASKEKKDCKDPCLKNGKSDRYCLKCATEMLEPILSK